MKMSNVRVFNYVKAHDGENFTAADIADAIDMDVRAVNAIITKTFCHHKVDGVTVPLMERVPATAELVTGRKKAIKLVKITDAGRSFIAIPDKESEK